MQSAVSIHAHEVIKLILAAESPLDPIALEKLVTERYGENLVFHTCSLSGMSLADLIQFLLQKGKALDLGGGLGIVRDRVCRDLGN